MADPMLGIADIAVIVAVMAISASIGIYFRFSGGRQKTTKEFLMAGKSMSPFPVVFSLIVTFVSAVMMLGVPAEVYDFGIYRIVAYSCSTLSNVISAYVFLPVYFQMGDSVSVYEYLERRFGMLTRKVSSILFILQQLFFMGVVLFAPALALSAVSHVNLYMSIISIGGVCTLYCCMGGLKAVLWTDVFQAVIMYTTLFAVFTKGILLADTSIPEAFRLVHARPSRFFSFDPSVRYTLWNCVMYGFLYGFCNYGCNQAEVQRMLSVKSLKQSQRAVIASVPLAIIFIAMNFFMGIVMYANYHDKNLVPKIIDKRDKMVPYFIMHSFNEYPGLAGLCVAGIFSGSLSTVSSSVNSLATVTMEDFVLPFFATRKRMADSTAAILAKVFACGYGFAAMICAFSMKDDGLVPGYTIIYGTLAGPVLGLFMLGMLTVTANQKGVLRGVLCGLLTTTSLGIVSYIKKRQYLSLCRSAATSSSVTDIFNSTSPFNATSTAFTTSITDIYVSATDVTTSERVFTSVPDIYTITTELLTTTHNPDTYCRQKDWLSVMWLLTIGFSITVIVGYISSLVIRRWESQEKRKYSDVDPALLSPLVRKWLAKSLPQNRTDNSEELVKLNGHLEA